LPNFPDIEDHTLLPHIDRDIPVVAVCNISETFYDFLSREADPTTRQLHIRGEQYRGDRALVWLGDPKLVFVSYPIPHADALLRQLNYTGTSYYAPMDPSAWLCLDILREDHLLKQLVSYADQFGRIQIVPYAVTKEFYQLVDSLRNDHGLTVILPESSEAQSLWIRDYIDTKTGFHHLVSRWLPDAHVRLPDAILVHDTTTAARAAYSAFVQRGRECLVKADDGENGIGNFHCNGNAKSLPELQRLLEKDSYLHDVPLVIEEFIPSKIVLSPSVEVFVPPLGSGEPVITYLSDQIFSGPGDFCGVIVSKRLTEQSWYEPMKEAGMAIADNLQKLGYAGHFDLDAVVDDNGQVYLLEVNSRRTGGTHVHDFASNIFGADYLDKVVLLSNDSMNSGGAQTWDDLQLTLEPFMYPIHGKNRGVFPMVSSALADDQFGCIFVAESDEEVLALQQEVQDTVKYALSVGMKRLVI
jgi:hypothetical protein